jgi:single-stranded-DNA-specific exonuclease
MPDQQENLPPAPSDPAPTDQRPWQFESLPELTDADADLLALVDAQPLLARLLKARGFDAPGAAQAFLDPGAHRPAPFSDLPDLDRAAALLAEAIHAGRKILIWGDFDVDGQTATALLYEALSPLTPTVFHIPDRARDSHGVQVGPLRGLIAEHAPDLLITCDTGITAYDGISFAKAQGLTVIITDHHEPGETLPDADAIINPHRLPLGHRLAGLPGVGVAYAQVAALYARLGLEAQPAAFLDLVALGIVADLAPQSGDTRYYLQLGLDALRRTSRIGLLSLLRVARVPIEALTAEDIAFQIGPRLNATSRLGDARVAVRLLTTDNPQEAEVLAQQIDMLNQERRQQQRALEVAAEAALAASYEGADTPAIVLAGPDWPPGLLGPVAGRLVEKYGRPAILFAQPVPGGALRGSARAPEPYHLVEALGPLAGMLTSWGGHAGAAGLALRPDKFDPFRHAIVSAFERQAERAHSRPSLRIDAEVPFAGATPAFAHALARLGPFGVGNPAPVFAARQVTIQRAEYLDRAHEHQRLTVFDDEGQTYFVYWWNSGDAPPPRGLKDIAYSVALKWDRDSTRDSVPVVSLTLVALREGPRSAAAPPTAARAIFDFRAAADPAASLAALRHDHPEFAVWAEGYAQAQSPGKTASLLPSGAPIVLYSAPASHAALDALLRHLDPPAVALIGVEPPAQEPPAFIRQLAGIIKTIVNRAGESQGVIAVDQLVARCAQPASTLRVAVRCLEELGVIIADTHKSTTWVFQIHGGAVLPTGDMRILSRSYEKLDYLLAESAAYRQFFRAAEAHQVLPRRWLEGPTKGQAR